MQQNENGMVFTIGTVVSHLLQKFVGSVGHPETSAHLVLRLLKALA